MVIQFKKNKLLIGTTEAPLRFSDMFKLGLSGGTTPSWQDIILSGNGSLTLANAKANGLNYLKLFGACSQADVPTPSSPVDIVCNNGVLMVSPNLADMSASNIVMGKYISPDGSVLASGYNFYNSKYIKVKPNTTYTLSFSDGLFFVSMSEYSSNSNSGFIIRNTVQSEAQTAPFDLFSMTITTSANTQYIRIGANMYRNVTLTLEDVQAVDWMLTESGTAQSYVPYMQIYTDGTTETIEVDTTGDTATAQNLLGTSEYSDEQNITTGAITRNIGIKVFDGTESSWAYDSNTKVFRVDVTDKVEGTVEVLCSHFKYSSSSTQANLTVASPKNAYKLKLAFKDTSITSKTAWTDWLAEQYSNGTPVIVVYPKATATTESTTAQHITLTSGTNTIEITQASINNLSFEVSYKGTTEGE